MNPLSQHRNPFRQSASKRLESLAMTVSVSSETELEKGRRELEEANLTIRFLIAGGFVTEEKAAQARTLAKGFK